MNKHILYLVITGIILTTISCYKDTGNYSYSDREKITVSGIEERYTKLFFEDNITLDPEVSSSEEGADFEYYWGMYLVPGQGTPSKMDTLSRTKRIDVRVTQPAGNWKLVFNVKNKKTGTAAFFFSDVVVGTRFTRGWYVLKSEENESDVDLFLTPSSIVPDSKIENVFSSVNGRKLEGRGFSFSFYSSYRSTVTGTNSPTRVLFLQTEEDLSVAYINTFGEIRGYNDLFYEPPAIKRLSAVLQGNQGYYTINNNLLHTLPTQASNSMMFGIPQLRDSKDSPYRLSKYHLATPVTVALFFDEASSSFVSPTARTTWFNSAVDAAGNKLPANNNNKILLYMGQKNNASLGWAVFQDKTDPLLKILCSVRPVMSGAATVVTVTLTPDTLKTIDNLYHASMYTVIFGDENLLYFVKGNEVWSRNLSNRSEILQYRVPAGEAITFIRHRKYTGSAAPEMPFYYNYFMIGTTSGGNYKVRMFTKTAGNLAAEPAVVLEGKGRMADVIYMSPDISDLTYPSSF